MEKPESLWKQIKRNVLASGNPELISAEQTVRTLLIIWVIVRVAVSAFLLVAAYDFTQIAATVVVLIFAFAAYSQKAIAGLALLGGAATVFMVFYQQYFALAALYHNMALYVAGFLLIFVGVVQFVIMLVLLASKKLNAYYQFVQTVQASLKAQAAAYSAWKRGR